MSDPVNFNEARAVKAEDSRLWTPIDALRAMIRDIESGEINPSAVLINYYDEKPDGSRVLRYYCANLNRPETIAMLVLAQHEAVISWTK